jgi:hypothetical protein
MLVLLVSIWPPSPAGSRPTSAAARADLLAPGWTAGMRMHGACVLRPPSAAERMHRRSLPGSIGCGPDRLRASGRWGRSLSHDWRRSNSPPFPWTGFRRAGSRDTNHFLQGWSEYCRNRRITPKCLETRVGCLLTTFAEPNKACLIFRKLNHLVASPELASPFRLQRVPRTDGQRERFLCS